MQESPLELHQFSHSHYNEKVRWALDYKAVPHVRICYMPGPHVPQIRRLTGQTETPVIRFDGHTVHGSAAILDLLEQRFPSPPLYPSDPATKAEALAIQARLDAELGPEIRLAVFDAVIDDTAFMIATFTSEQPAWKRAPYQALFPLIRPVMKKQMHITPENGRHARERVEKLMDWIAEKAAATGYLAGGAFSVADLTAAALLGPAALYDHPDMKQAERRPARYTELCATWATHPAMQWAHRVYRDHRPPRRGIVIA